MASKLPHTCCMIYLLTSCSLFDQNDYITTGDVGEVNGEHFMYTVYQTGIDNYRVELKVTTDTLPVFEYYINDGIYTKDDPFPFRISNDTLSLSIPYQHCKSYNRTPKGTTIELTNDKDPSIKPCTD